MYACEFVKKGLMDVEQAFVTQRITLLGGPGVLARGNLA